MSNVNNCLSKVFLFSLLLTICLPNEIVIAEDYIIGVGDKLSILRIISTKDGREIKDKEHVRVRPDGKISYPLIGEIKASGLTPLQLNKTLTDKLSVFYKNPQITINLLESNLLTVYIYGNLRGSGPKQLKDSTNILQLFSMLGKLPKSIDLETSFIVRNNKRLSVNLYSLLQEGDLNQNINLKNGDTIFFREKPEATKPVVKKLGKFKNIIRIVGEVRHEKTIKYEKGMTILDAISNAGGFTPYARPSGTKVVRRRGDKVEEILIDMDAVRDGEIDKNIPLEPGDLISVPASLF